MSTTTEARMRVLFLDDSEERHTIIGRQARMGNHDVEPVWSAAQAIERLEETVARALAWDVVCLDHDLSTDHMLRAFQGHESLNQRGDGTGYDVACWLEEHPEAWPFIGQVIVHSINSEGARRMHMAMRGLGRRVVRQPFGTWHLPGSRIV